MRNVKPLIISILLMLFVTACASTSETIEEPEEDAQASAPPVIEPEPVVVKEEPAPEPVAMQEVLPQTQAPEPEPLQNIVYFDFDQAQLRSDAMDLLAAHAERLKQMDQTIQVEGHADERGSKEYNLQLSKKRALAVRDFLVGHGVSASQIKIMPYGEDLPQVIGNYESAWEKNRRVELK